VFRYERCDRCQRSDMHRGLLQVLDALVDQACDAADSNVDSPNADAEFQLKCIRKIVKNVMNSIS